MKWHPYYNEPYMITLKHGDDFYAEVIYMFDEEDDAWFDYLYDAVVRIGDDDKHEYETNSLADAISFCESLLTTHIGGES